MHVTEKRPARRTNRHGTPASGSTLLTRRQEQHLARRYRKGDIGAGQELAARNVRFVMKIAHEYARFGLPVDDLIGEGNVGLMKAVEKFDHRRNFRFCTYAVWWIRALIASYVIKNFSLVKIGTTQAQRTLFFSLQKKKREIARQFGEDAANDPERVAAELGVSPKIVREMEVRLQRDARLDAPVAGTEGQATYKDFLQSGGPLQDELFGRRETALKCGRAIRVALTKLEPREQYIVEHRLLSENKKTLAQIGVKFGCSRERARQLQVRTEVKLRRILAPFNPFGKE